MLSVAVSVWKYCVHTKWADEVASNGFKANKAPYECTNDAIWHTTQSE